MEPRNGTLVQIIFQFVTEPGPSPKAARPLQAQQQPDPAAFAVPAGFGAGMANPGYGFGAPPPGPQDFGLKGPFSDPSFYHNTAQGRMDPFVKSDII